MADPVAVSAECAELRTGGGRWCDWCDMPDLEIMMVAVTERAAAGWRRGSAGRGELGSFAKAFKFPLVSFDLLYSPLNPLPSPSSTHPPIALATPPENHSLPLCDASLIRSHVIALCAFAISCFSANEGKRASSSAPRYREETSWDVLRREWLRERRRSAGGG